MRENKEESATLTSLVDEGEWNFLAVKEATTITRGCHTEMMREYEERTTSKVRGCPDTGVSWLANRDRKAANWWSRRSTWHHHRRLLLPTVMVVNFFLSYFLIFFLPSFALRFFSFWRKLLTPATPSNTPPPPPTASLYNVYAQTEMGVFFFSLISIPSFVLCLYSPPTHSIQPTATLYTRHTSWVYDELFVFLFFCVHIRAKRRCWDFVYLKEEEVRRRV